MRTALAASALPFLADDGDEDRGVLWRVMQVVRRSSLRISAPILVLMTACRLGEASRDDVVPDAGLEVTGSEAVADVAKKQAHLVVNHMLSNAPRIVEKM